MTPAAWRRVGELFHAAIERPASEWETFVAGATDDATIAREVRRLLREHEEADGFLEPTADRSVGRAFDEASSEHAWDVSGKIGRYRLGAVVGRGGQGTVYDAVDEETNERVALKLLTGLSRFSATRIRRFEREAELCSRLTHPGICAVRGSGTVDGVPYLAMRFVPGETLAERIRRAREVSAGAGRATLAPLAPLVAATPDAEGRSPLDLVLRLLEDVARAVHAAHQVGVIHRDIKPSNLMITPEGTPVALDFGLARDLDGEGDALTASGDVMGTPAYMAPEQIRRGGPPVDRRVDVYGLGATLFECITLHRPFEAPTREGLYREILTAEAPDPRRFHSALPRALTVVVATALAKDPDRRYQSAAALADELRRVRERAPIRARAAGPADRVFRWGRRNPLVAALLLLVFLLLTGGLVAAVRANRELRREKERADKWQADSQRLADNVLLDQILRREEELWPALPERVPALRAWLDEARALRAHRDDHRRFLAELRRSGQGDDEGRHRFDDRNEQWLHDVLADLVRRFEGFDATVASVASRLSFALEVEQRSIVDHRATWSEVVAAIARDDRFAGLALAPQLGLVPLGADPASGLHEFLHLATHEGPLPERDARGRLGLDGRTGIVLVLLPPGDFRIGAVPSRDGRTRGPHVDPQADPDEGPVTAATTRAFFIAKHEMSLGAWRRASGPHEESEPDDLLPVGDVSWEAADRVVRRIGLALPSEAEWEYATRAGTTTIWWPGDEVGDLADAVNFGDLRFYGGAPPPGVVLPDDGWSESAPVFSARPNAFGLHHTLGNVWEWCADAYGSYEGDRIDGSRPRTADDEAMRVYRGGGYSNSPQACRSANRFGRNPAYRIRSLGLRPSCAVRGAAD